MCSLGVSRYTGIDDNRNIQSNNYQYRVNLVCDDIPVLAITAIDKINKSIKIKSLLLSHHHRTCALVSEILESVLQTVQKQFTYRQYILTDLYRWQCAK